MFTTLRTLFSSSAKVFKYNDDLITFTLPGEWLREDEPSVRVSVLNDRHNTRYLVSLLRVSEPMPSREEKLRKIETLAALRKEELDKLSLSRVRIGEPEIIELGDKLIYDFMAKSSEPEVQMYFRFIQRRDLIASFSLYDTSGQAPEEHVKLLRQAFAATSIK